MIQPSWGVVTAEIGSSFRRSCRRPALDHRVDVSKTVRKLIGEGAKAVSITLVVIGADYREDKELLRLDGVSLNFHD